MFVLHHGLKGRNKTTNTPMVDWWEAHCPHKGFYDYDDELDTLEPIRSRAAKKGKQTPRKTDTDGQTTSADDRKTAADDWEPVADDRKSAVVDRKTVADNRKTVVDNRKTAADDRKTVADNRKTVADDRKTVADDGKPAVDNRKTVKDYKTSSQSDGGASNVVSTSVKPTTQQIDPVRSSSKDVKPAPHTNNTAKSNIKDVEDMLASLKLDVSDQDLKNFHQVTESSVKSDKDLKAVVELVYKRCLSDQEFSKTGASICDKLATLEVGGVKFRSALLSMLQVDFKNKDDIRKRSRTRFLNLFSFMCQVFGNMKTASGEVFKPLVNPVYDCISVILEAEENDEDELECMSLQLQSVGKDMEQSDAEKMNQVMEQARTKIIRDGSSARSRCTLLELVECYARDWRTVPNDITRFYCDTMADILAGMID